jgi:hypothetical protein
MKTIFQIVIIILVSQSLFSQTDYPQLDNYFKCFSELKSQSITKLDEVNRKYIDKLGNLSPRDLNILSLDEHIFSLPLKEFLSIIRKRTLAYQEDLFQPEERKLKHDDNIIRSGYNDSVRFGIFEGILQNRIKKEYDESTMVLLLSPILLKITILGIRKELFTTKEGITLGKVIVSAKIKDIIKGQGHFKNGETIEFYYMPFWKKKSESFVQEESYFVSLYPLINNEDFSKMIALQVNSVNDGFIKIEDNIVQDINNFYGYGNTDWTSFKNNIKDLLKKLEY